MYKQKFAIHSSPTFSIYHEIGFVEVKEIMHSQNQNICGHSIKMRQSPIFSKNIEYMAYFCLHIQVLLFDLMKK